MLQPTIVIAPPPAECNTSAAWTFFCNSGFLSCCYELRNTLLFDIQFVPYCTTKWIFWLGKNKFD